MFRAGREKRWLGISVGERAMRVAEPAGVDGTGRAGEFIYPTDLTLENGAELGQALGRFLLEGNFASLPVVFGVPAKWVISKPYQIPPTDAATAANILWLHASNDVPAELGPMIFDFAGQASPQHTTSLLLLGLQQRWMDRLVAVAKAAKLRIAAVMPSALAVGAATAGYVNPSLILSICLENAELVSQDGSQTRALKHIGSAANPGALATELRRAAAGSNAKSLVLWDEAGLDAQSLEALRGAVQLPLIAARGQWMGAGEGRKGLAAAALAWNGGGGKTRPANFVHPRLSAPKTSAVRGRAFWLSTAAAAVGLAAVVGFGDLANLQRQVSWADGQLQLLGPSVETARKFVASTEFAAAFQSTRPRYLACVRDLTVALPPDGQTYLLSFNLRTDMSGEIVGRSSSEQNVLNLVDKLNAGGRFAELNCKLDPPAKAGNQTEVSFSVMFSYLPHT